MRRGGRLAPVLLRVLRLALQGVLFFTLLSIVVGLASAETGLLEKGVLVALVGIVVWLASLVRRIGARSALRSA